MRARFGFVFVCSMKERGQVQVSSAAELPAMEQMSVREGVQAYEGEGGAKEASTSNVGDTTGWS